MIKLMEYMWREPWPKNQNQNQNLLDVTESK